MKRSFLFSILCLAGLFTVACYDLAALQSPPPDSMTASPTCYDTLSDIGTNDFSIWFKVTTRASVTSTLLYQRSTCDARNDLWDVQLTPSGQVRTAIIEAGNGVYTDFTTHLAVNDGNAHAVKLNRVGLSVSVLIDDVESGNAPAPQRLHALPPLGIASGDPCEAANVRALLGTISDVCLLKP